MSVYIRRLLRLGYSVAISVKDRAYAVELKRGDFFYEHCFDKALCDASFSDGLEIEMARLTRMIERHSHFHGNKPLAEGFAICGKT